MKALRTIWCYIEVLYAKSLVLIGIKKTTSVIPNGPYCYTWLDRPDGSLGGKVKVCKYFRHAGEDSACTYVGFIGWDSCLSDQCKICGVNEGTE